MPLDRRKFMKVAGTAAAVGMFSFAFQNATFDRIKAETLPGVGDIGHYSDTPKRYEDSVWLEEHIDTAAFVAACSRCGVCANVCPFKAIRFDGVYFPQLTNATRHKCPGLDQCGLCAVNCPTEAIADAFRDMPVEDRTPGAMDKAWWEGPSNEAERNLVGLDK